MLSRNLFTKYVLFPIACVFLPMSLTGQDRRIGFIGFFGQDGFDTAAIRSRLPFRIGDPVFLGENEQEATDLRDRWRQSVRASLKEIIGRDPTDVERVCCTSAGEVLIYIGLPGKSYRPIHYNSVPAGSVRLPASVVESDNAIEPLLMKAILEGRGAEDDSEGYALSKDPDVRTKQLEFRDEARRNERQVFKVLEGSRDADERSVAAEAVGYLPQTRQQIDALVRASFDSNDEVRNNAARALGVLLISKPELTRQVPLKPFIGLLNSGTWTDRNKGLMVANAIAKGRDPKILQQLRSQAAPALIEMAQWYKGHAFAARFILGWIAGLDDNKIFELADQDAPDALIQAFEKIPPKNSQ